jgi:hypothetical protein
VGDKAIVELMDHHGKSLAFLDVNGLDIVTKEAWMHVATSAISLQHMDWSWCRSVDDDIVSCMVQTAQAHPLDLSTRMQIRVWGCEKVTEFIPNLQAARVRIIGRECDTL